jgi:hypothetical protein
MPNPAMDMNQAINFLIEEITTLRGENLANRVLVTYALDALISTTERKEEALHIIRGKSLKTLEDISYEDCSKDAHQLEIRHAKMRVEQAVEELRRVHGLRKGNAH